MTTVSVIVSDVDAFVNYQNQNRGQTLGGGGTLPLDYDALTGTVPSGGNSVTGISGIASGAPVIALTPSQTGNGVVVDGGISTTASSSGADSYSLAVATNGMLTLTDNNTGNSQSVTGASYILFDGAATTSPGVYQSLDIIATGNNAVLAAMYNAAFGRVPDLPGLEFYEDQFGTSAVPNLHAAAVFFEGSPEFKALFPALQTTPDNGGPNDQAFTTDLYAQILHRTPTTAELSFYNEYMQGTLSGETGPGNRADELIYFANSAENQKAISAAEGGWLINPANGAVNFGAMTQASANALIASEAASGTINAADFANMPNTDKAGTGTVSVIGADYVIPGTNIVNAFPEISSLQANITINLSSQYYVGQMDAANITINGVSSGGAIVFTPSSQGLQNCLNGGGTVNLFGNNNLVHTGSYGDGGVTVPTEVNGWNSTDVLTQTGLSVGVAGTVLVGSSSTPISGAALAAEDHSQGFEPVFNVFAVNVGAIKDDSVASIVVAANQVYRVADAQYENAFFFGQDPQGNTMVWWWRGDTAHTGSIEASDIAGAVELVGVSAATLNSSNFHS